tara:strand:- start:13 stop:204 length:192 start_codon:yes stop_codon:yes gene_type:complete
VCREVDRIQADDAALDITVEFVVDVHFFKRNIESSGDRLDRNGSFRHCTVPRPRFFLIQNCNI